MARDKGKDEKAEKADDGKFVPPDFDEDAFIHKELVSFRTTSILFLWGIVAALVSWAIYGPMGADRGAWFAGLAICAAFGLSLKFLYARLKVDIKHFGRREWWGTGFLFFFTWLSFFLLLVNPPISDYAPPEVDIFVSPPGQAAGGPVVIDLFVEDNVDVDDFTFTLEGDTVLAARADLADLGHGHYRLERSGLGAGSYQVTASATDDKGHSTTEQATFMVGDQALELVLPDNSVLDGPTDTVYVQAEAEKCKTRRGVATGAYPCLRLVQLQLVGGGLVNLSYSDELGGWAATSNTVGWKMGENNFTVRAEFVDRFHGTTRIPGGEFVLSEHVTVDVQRAPSADPLDPKVPRQPGTPTRSTPGIEPGAVALAIVGGALLLRRRTA